MCEMVNLYVPRAPALLGPPVRGLHFKSQGEIQHDFATRFATGPGSFLHGYGSGSCLCGFDDWPALYDVARDLIERNDVAYVAALKFWSGDRYQLAERELDPDDAEQCTPVRDGELIILRCGPAEQRRHRQVRRDLTRHVGARVTLRLKSGRALHGLLAAFDPDSEVGTLDDKPFVAAQVLEVASASATRAPG